MVAAKKNVRTLNRTRHAQQASNVKDLLLDDLKCHAELASKTGETFSARSANTDDNAHLDIYARGFWNNHQDAFFNVRVFYPNAPSNRSTDAYRRHKQAKKGVYGQRVREIEHGVFTPLVLSTNGGMGKEAVTFYKQLVDIIAQKRQHPSISRQHPYPMVMGWLRCRLSFASI